MLENLPYLRSEAKKRLTEFVENGLRSYSHSRNFDFGQENRKNISLLSPYVRRRLLTESDICRTALSKFSFHVIEKFIQEVCWRTYWKGWLEHHPSVFKDYQSRLKELERSPLRASEYQKAIRSETGIECFDFWVRELIETGYLHNHTRMWFASIWIFTLKLPWEWGAEFFYQHLLDGDSASNTLSWRWVAGLQTLGKFYLASSENINKFTEGRHNPGSKLCTTAEALASDKIFQKQEVKLNTDLPVDLQDFDLLVHLDDLSFGHYFAQKLASKEIQPSRILVPSIDLYRRNENLSDKVLQFDQLCMEDTIDSLKRKFRAEVVRLATVESLSSSSKTILTSRGFVGPGAEFLSALRRASPDKSIVEIDRDWDAAFFPHSQKGYFKLKQEIPVLLQALT